MRKIFFILFGLALVVLILLVDWRDKWEQVTRSKTVEQAEQALPYLDPSESLPSEDSARESSESDPAGDWASDSLEWMDTESSLPASFDEAVQAMRQQSEDLAAKHLYNNASSPPLARLPDSRPAAGRAPALERPALKRPQPFQDLDEQPYLDESRQLLRQTLRNYDHLRPVRPAPSQPESERDRP